MIEDDERGHFVNECVHERATLIRLETDGGACEMRESEEVQSGRGNAASGGNSAVDCEEVQVRVRED